MTLAYGSSSIEAVLVDLDDVLVPFHSVGAWQWAWHPQGPVLGERRVRAAVRRALKAWDKRRWEGLTGRAAPADLPALEAHLASTLAGIAGHPLPDEETKAVVRRLFHPMGEVERYPDVLPFLDRLRTANVRATVVTPLPAESARWLLRRAGLPDSLLGLAGDPPGPILPDRRAFRSVTDGLSVAPDRTAYVGDLFWSDVHAAARAGLGAILLDRNDAWPKVQSGRITTLAGFETALAAGTSPASEETPVGDGGAGRAAPP